MGKTERKLWNVVEGSRVLRGCWRSHKRKVMGKKYNLSIVRHKNSQEVSYRWPMPIQSLEHQQ